MAKFLNNTGLARLVALIKQALGGKADKTELPLVVTFTGVDDNISCDTSIADIYAAYSSGRHVVGHRNGNEQWELTSSGPNSALFSALITSMQSVLVGNNDGSVDTWLSVITYYQEALTFDSAPTAGSSNPVTSGGVKTALDGKQATLVSGTNIKSINNASILGSGNIDLKPTDFLIIVTQSGSSIVADKTYEQITTAFNAGRNLIVKKGDDVFHISHENGREFVFVSEGKMGNQLRYKLTLTSQGEWVYLFESIDATEISIVNDDTHGRWYNGDQVEEALVALSDAIDDLGTPNEIESIATTESQASGGNNTVTITETNGTTTTFNVKNGINGGSLGDVDIVDVTGNRTDAVMSQKGVTEYGRKVTAEDLAGTSDWIKAELVEEGWVMNRALNTSGTLSTVSGYITSMFIPISDIKSHILILCYNYNSGNIINMCFYDSNKTFISGLYWTATVHNTRTITMGTSSSYDNVAYVRVTFNPNKFSECYLLDYTTNEYIIKCDKYLIELEKDLNISYGTFENCILMQQMGDNEIKTMSQKAISDAINYNTNIERGTGFTLNSNVYYRYLKLTPKAVSLLNASDKMTFMFSTRSTGNYMDYRYFRFGNGNPASNDTDGTNGVYLGWSYNRNLSANGVDYSLNKPNSNTSPTPDVWLVTWDRINGVVKFYNRTTLVNTLTSDSYKKTQFVNSSGLLTILGGDNNTRIYDIRLFDFDISHLFNNSDVKLEIDYLDGTGVLPSQFLSNYTVANSDSSFNTEVNSFQGGGYGATCTYTLDGDNYHIVVKDTTTTSQACGGKPYYLGRSNRAQLEKLEFEVVSGVIRTSIDPNNASTVHYYHIYDSNNDEISDYSNIGVGSYTLIRTSSTTGARLDFYKVSGNVEVIMNRNMRYKPISCVFHWSGDVMYNKKFYDDQTKEFITLYTSRVCDTPYTEHTIVKTPQRVILNSTANMLPHYSGEMAITGGKVYIGMPDYTWKQINNS